MTAAAGKLELWTVYDSPTDFPGRFVARKFLLDQPTTDFVEGATLEEVRGKLPPNLFRMNRDLTDDANIVEIWL